MSDHLKKARLTQDHIQNIFLSASQPLISVATSFISYKASFQLFIACKKLSSSKRLSKNISIADRTILFRTKAGIQTITKRNAEKTLEKVFSEWTTLKKEEIEKKMILRKRKILEESEHFTENLKKLWDIESPYAIKLIRANHLLSDEVKKNDRCLYRPRK